MTASTLTDSWRIKRLEVKNFKGIDEVALDFPLPDMPRDPDVHVMGSRNGLGKTTLLEACTLLCVGTTVRVNPLDINEVFGDGAAERLVRSGTEQAVLTGEFTHDQTEYTTVLRLNRGGEMKAETHPRRRPAPSKESGERSPRFADMENLSRVARHMLGLSADPVWVPPCLYFHSYRRVQEGNPEMGMMVDSEESYRRWPGRYSPRMRAAPDAVSLVSLFKVEVLRAMMRRANLFETLDGDATGGALEILNGLIKTYAQGRIEKLRPAADNTVDFRVTPLGGGGLLCLRRAEFRSEGNHFHAVPCLALHPREPCYCDD
ncbi:MAG: AAA family ATPase [Magnetococcus sp. WYHC-3]